MSESKFDASEELQQISESVRIFTERIATKAAAGKELSAGYVNCLSNLVTMLVRSVVARDILAFRAHAGRRCVTEEDVLLIARKAPFYGKLKRYMEDELGVNATKGRRSKL